MPIRDARAGDATACREVYAPYVTGTAITFETVVPEPREMAQRIATAQQRHAWLVLEEGGELRGYAYAGTFRPRHAYRWATEVSLYLDRDATGRGLGRLLYTALLDRLTAQGFVTAVAGMTLPNEASARLHRALGFTDVGVFRRVGHKQGTWHDVAWVQRPLAEPDGLPAETR